MGAKDKIDPLAGFFAMAMVKASVTPKDGLEALYASMRRDLDSQFSGTSDEYQRAVRKLARVCRV